MPEPEIAVAWSAIEGALMDANNRLENSSELEMDVSALKLARNLVKGGALDDKELSLLKRM